MATTDPRGTDTATDADLATAVSESTLLTVIARADGTALAAAGALADLATKTGTPFQICLAETRDEAANRARAADESATIIAIGPSTPDADVILGDSVPAKLISRAADRLEQSVPPELVAAGVLAAEQPLSIADSALESLEERGITSEPGVVSPGEDLVDSLAHSTLVHGPFAGTPDRARSLLDELGSEPSPRTVASAVAIAGTRADNRPPSGGQAIERVLQPHPIQGPWGSLEGLADILEATARSAPGTATALALGHADQEVVLDAWRHHGQTVHQAVREADLARYDGIVETGATAASPASVARLIRDFRSPEPAVVVLGEDKIGLATTERNAVQWLAGALGPDHVGGHGRVAVANPTDLEASAAEVREER